MNRGFSLFELLVVLVIIGLMSALVVPKLAGSMSNIDLRTASKKISASLRYARSRAASGRIKYLALFDLDRERVVIAPDKGQPEDGREENRAGHKKNALYSFSYDLPEGVGLETAVSDDEVDSGLFRLVFFPSGRSSGGSVVLANDRGKRLRIDIDFITGCVRLTD